MRSIRQALFTAPRAVLLTALVMVLVLLRPLGSADAATPAVAWSLAALAQPTSFSADQSSPCAEHGICDKYTLVLTDVGTRASSGTITVNDTLPPGVTTSGAPGGESESMKWACATREVAGHEIVTCTTASSIPALAAAAAIEVPVMIAATTGTLINLVEVTGGGARAAVSAATPTPMLAPPLPFGLLEFNATTLGLAGELSTEAGSHPGAFTASLTFPSTYAVGSSNSGLAPHPVEDVKQIVIDLPAGLVGNPGAAPACSLVELTNSSCALRTRVGTLVLFEAGGAETDLSLFNLVPEHGFAAEFGIYDPGLRRATVLYGTVVGGGAESHLRLISAPLNSIATIDGLSVTFFGDPAEIDNSPLSRAAFFTNPSDCSASGFTTTVHVDSWQHPARSVEPGGEADLSEPNWKSASVTAPPVTGCAALQFHPTFSFAPEGLHGQADEPSGYEAALEVKSNEDPRGLATPPLRTAVLTLSPGVTISPAAADSLLGCHESGPEGIELQAPEPGHCPPASTVGSAELVAPTLKDALKGSVYIGQPACGGPAQPPCTEEAAETGGLFALYVEAGSEESGVHLKLRAKVEVGGNGVHSVQAGLQPGQMRITLADLPQQPVSELKLRFTGGPGALLVNPHSCGSFVTASDLEPWSHRPAPGEMAGTPNATSTSAFTITGCDGKFAPSFVAGTVNPQAGAASPFMLTFSRQDREQDVAGVTASLPPGLLGKVAGIPECGQADASAGTCSAASRIGSATVAVGAGSRPLWLTGSAYLTGPPPGRDPNELDAPFGLAVVIPARVGPFNLGQIVVHATIAIDRRTAALTVSIEPLSRIVDGVPLQVRTVNLRVDDLFLNPTNCNPQAIDATISSVQGATAVVANHFQVTDCRSLRFSPKLTALTYGDGQFTGHGANLHVKITTAEGQANMRSLKLDLPRRLPARLETIQKACPESAFERNPATCPNASVIGSAVVATPVLSVPLSGPAILVGHGGKAFPDLVLMLQGEGVRIELTGALFVDEHNITSITFRSIPDVPIRRLDLVLPEGSTSVLAASASLCTRPLRILAAVTGQNGARLKLTVKVAVAGCRHRRKSHSPHRRT